MIAASHRRPPVAPAGSATPTTALMIMFVAGAVASPQNIMMVALSVGALAVIWWNALASPFRTILAAYMSLQWLQASMVVWIAAAFQIDLSLPTQVRLCDTCSMMVVGRMTQEAIALALVCLAATAIGARWLQPRIGTFRPEPFIRDLSEVRLFACYMAFLAMSRLTGPLAGGGLAQPLIVLGDVRYVFMVLLTLIFVTLGRGRGFLLAIYGIEVAQGVIGYFSGFKTVFYVGIAALLTLYFRLGSKVRPIIFASVVCVASLGVTWTMIKPTFRAMLNQGTGTQTTTLSVTERFKALGTATSGTKEGGWREGLADLALRISYTEYLGLAMDYVPAAKEHTGGALWGEAIAFVMKPRILFPDKPALQSDSERTMMYTGQTLGSDSMGTSISIGYVGESYIDGGILGAIAISFVLGAMYGLSARRLLIWVRHDVAIYVASIAVLLQLSQQFEISNMKLFPGFIWACIVVSGFVLWLWPPLRSFCSVGATPPRGWTPNRLDNTFDRSARR